MNLKYIIILITISVGNLFIISCNDDDPPIVNPEELITTLNYFLVTGAGDTVTLSFRDLDGDGGNAPVVTVEPLASNTTYSGTVQLLNEAENPVQNITDEVQAEAEAHQFFFIPSDMSISVSYSDMDADGNPIGVLSAINTTTAGMYQLSIELRHEPQKFAAGVSDGDITNAGGESDIEITFDITIQ